MAQAESLQHGKAGLEEELVENREEEPTREMLMAIHQVISENNLNTAEDEDNCDSDISEGVVTKSAGTVDNLRELFSPGETSEEDCEQASGFTGHGNQPGVTVTATSTPSALEEMDCDGVNSNQHDQGEHDQTDERCGKNNRKKRKINTVEGDSNSQLFPLFVKDQKETEIKGKRSERKRGNKNQKEGKREASQDCDKDSEILKLLDLSEDNLRVVDVRTVVQLFGRVKVCVSELRDTYTKGLATAKKDMNKQTTEKMAQFKKDTVKDTDREVQKSMEMYQQKLDKLEENMEKQKKKNDIQAELIKYNFALMQDLSRRLDTVEMNTARRSGILTGLNFSDNKGERIKQVEAFFEDTLNININIEDAYFLGDAEQKVVVVIFATSRDKQMVWENKSELKHFKGEKGKQIYLNDYLPQGVGEKRRKEREVVAEVKSRKDVKISTEYTKKGLKVGGQLYRKKVVSPKPGDLLDLTSEELEEILALEVDKGQRKVIEDSVFLAYAASVSTHQEIRRLYLKIKLLHASARHIVCAYNLPGRDRHYLQDFEDDGEHGAGRALLNSMLENDLQNKVIFIARFCGNTKLGGSRLSSYVESAKDVIKHHPYNKVRKENQSLYNEAYQREYRRLKEHAKKKAEAAGTSEGESTGQTHHYMPRSFSKETKTKHLRVN